MSNEQLFLLIRISNKEYNTKCYFTNFRILTVSDKYIYDTPLCFIKNHYIKKPILRGSNYIYIELNYANLKNNLPKYILDNYSPGELQATNYNLPKYTMIKFRDKLSNIDEAYNVMKINLSGREWKVK